MQRTHYQAPRFGPGEATPRRVRDELVACLVEAFGSVRRAPNASPNPIQLRNDVERFVHRALEEAGGDYADPTLEGLQAVIRYWRKHGGTIVSDATTVQHHSDEMNKLVSQVVASAPSSANA